MNLYIETERSLKTVVLPILERLHQEIKSKAKELKTGAAKSAKAVEKARAATQKHMELLGQQVASFDAAAHAKIEQQHDPYVIRRGINYRLNKQVNEENNNRKDILVVQNSFQQFESHVLRTIQGSLEQYFQVMNGQLNRQIALNTDTLGNFQRVPPDFEWVNFAVRNAQTLIDPDSPPRSLANISFPNQDHRATRPLIEGLVERKSRNLVKGYNNNFYAITPALYLHEYKDTDDFRKDPFPDLSFYLPDCTLGGVDGVKFSFKGKDVSSGKVGNAFHTNMDMHFKARSPAEAERWYTIIKDCHQSATNGQLSSVPAVGSGGGAAAATASAATTSPSAAQSPSEGSHPPPYAEGPSTSDNTQATGTTGGTQTPVAAAGTSSDATSTTPAAAESSEKAAAATAGTSGEKEKAAEANGKA